MQEIINAFPGYEFKVMEDGKKHNMYRGVDLGKGGYVYAEPGMYSNVALIDAASMHPTSIVMLNKLGNYTQRYADLRAARVFIKHKDYESAGKLFGGKLQKYLTSDDEAGALSKALKLPLNAFFGISFASYSNPAKDPRDENNIIALRGALFMKTLQDEVVKKGFRVVHIKTDSIKIPNATPEIIKFVQDFGKKYGYEMEHEATYERMCLVNDAVYIAKYDSGKWTATGAQFQIPYVFKKLFSKEPIIFDDLCETKSVSTQLYLDMNEGLIDVTEYEKELAKLETKYLKGELSDTTWESECSRLMPLIEKGHKYVFIGKVGRFCPIKEGRGGGLLMREKDGKYYAATGSKGYRWLESEVVKETGKEEDIDESYYISLVDEAVKTISQYGDFERFVAEEPYQSDTDDLARAINVPEGIDEEIPFE